MKSTTTLTAEDISHLIVLVRNHWPEIYHYETGVANLALNRVQAIAEQEGVAAITPLRLEGLREIVEEYILPFAEIARIRDLIAAQQKSKEEP
jgi:hypothetical protein